MSPSRDELAAGADQDLWAITVARMTPPVRATLQQCALVTSFDEATYRDVLRAPDGPELDELRRRGRIRTLSGAAERYQVEPHLREAAWASWWGGAENSTGPPVVPEPLAEYARRLGQYFRETGQPLEELRALVLAEPAATRDRFVRLYQEADDSFDLARCQDVIDVLAMPDRVNLIPIDLAGLRDEYQQYLTARGLWETEYHQTSRYFSRPSLEKHLYALLDGDASRVLQLHASGGMGKTMLLRWFVARACLGRRPQVPCARIDFDVIDPVNAARHPWLLLLELAAQLDPQIVGRPLQELLREYDSYRRLLHSGRGEMPETTELSPQDIENVTGRFLGSLSERRSDGPIVVILDTLEEVVLRPSTGLDAFLDLLHRLHDQVPTVRLVFSGRYDLRERVDDFAARFPGAVSVEVTEFSKQESARYLTDIRGLTSEPLVEAIVNKCRGLPFTLAVFGDVVQGDPGLNPADIRLSTGPALLYCIVRILERVDDDRLRWILRYGVLPRGLSRDFLVRVLQPYLVAGITGESKQDDPDKDPRPVRPIEIFRQGVDEPPQSPEDLREMWARLAQYASVASWVSMQADVLVFHPRLRAPLRDLLRKQPVYPHLQHDATRYYEDLAADEPGQWSRWMREAIYHRFQSDGPSAIESWRTAVEYARQRRRPDWVADLAADVVAMGELDDEDGGPPAVGYQTLYEAQLELARADAEAARAGALAGHSTLWSRVEAHLSEAERLLQRSEVLGPTIRHRILAATLAVARGEARTALAHLALVRMSPEQERDALVTQADAESLLGEASAEDALRGAMDLSERLGDADGAVRISLDIVRRRIEQDRSDEALPWCRWAAGVDLSDQLRSHVNTLTATVLLRLGRPASALQELEAAAERTAEPHPAEYDAPLAESLLALRRAAKARELLREVPAAERDVPGHWQRVLLRARAGSRLLLVSEAREQLESGLQANTALEELRPLVEELAVLHMRTVGNLREAEPYIQLAESYRDRNGRPPSSARLLTVELLQRLGQAQRAAAVLDEVVTQLSGSRAPASALVDAAVVGVALNTAEARRTYVPLLIHHLGRIPAIGTRLSLLGGLRRCTDLGTPEDFSGLVPLVLHPWERAPADTGDLNDLDRAYLDLVVVEVERLLRRRGDAVARLRRAVETLDKGASLVWWDWIRAMERISAATATEPEPPKTLLSHHAAYPGLCAAYLIDLTRRRFGIDPLPQSQERLDEAARLLDQRGTMTFAYHAVLQDLYAKLARAQGREDAMREHAGRAASIWAELGNVEARARYQTSVGVAVSASRPPPGEVVVTVEHQQSGGMAVRVEPGAQLRSLATPPWVEATGAADAPGITMLADEIRESWTSWARRAGDLIIADSMEPALSEMESPVDLRLELSSPTLSAAPWELVAPGGRILTRRPDVRYVYRSVDQPEGERAETLLLQRGLSRLGLLSGPLDGVLGPSTRRDLHRFQQRVSLRESDRPGAGTWDALRRELRDGSDLRRLHAVVLQPDVARSIRSGTGVTGSLKDAEAIYHRHGLRASVLNNPSGEGLSAFAGAVERTGRDSPDIVHVCAAVGVRSGVPFLHFYAEPYGAGEILTIQRLGEFVARLRRPLSPLVIIDVAAPTGPREMVRQLLLRNFLAEQLLRLGRVASIVAIGPPQDSYASETQRDTLIETLANGGNAAEACLRLWQVAQGDDESLTQVLSFAGTALFSSLSMAALSGTGTL